MVSAEVIAQQTAESQQQQQTDNQISVAINNKLQGSSELRPLDLGVWVHDGTATLSGAVPTPALREHADALVQTVPGVKSVDDRLTIGTESADRQTSDTGQSPEMAPPPPPQQEQGAYEAGPEQQGPEQQGPEQAGPEQPGPENGNMAPVPPGYTPQNNDQNGPPPLPPPPPPPQEGQDLRNAPMVTVAAGTPVTIMMLDGVDSKHTHPGDHFRGVLVRDVVLQDGIIAIPRGAYVHGDVIDARGPGHLKGHPKLALQLSNLEMADMHYPLTSYVWDRRGPGKGAQTTNNVVGGAVVGTAIGGFSGGGAGALLGATLGGLGGAGLSSLSSGARVVVPPESVLTFYLNAPLTVRELNMNQIRSLAGNVPATGYGNGPGPGYPPPGYPPPPGYAPPPPPPGGPPGGYPY